MSPPSLRVTYRHHRLFAVYSGRCCAFGDRRGVPVPPPRWRGPARGSGAPWLGFLTAPGPRGKEDGGGSAPPRAPTGVTEGCGDMAGDTPTGVTEGWGTPRGHPTVGDGGMGGATCQRWGLEGHPGGDTPGAAWGQATCVWGGSDMGLHRGMLPLGAEGGWGEAQQWDTPQVGMGVTRAGVTPRGGRWDMGVHSGVTPVGAGGTWGGHSRVKSGGRGAWGAQGGDTHWGVDGTQGGHRGDTHGYGWDTGCTMG